MWPAGRVLFRPCIRSRLLLYIDFLMIDWLTEWLLADWLHGISRLVDSLIIYTYCICARFQVLMAAGMLMTASWDVAQCSFMEVDRRFRVTCCLYHQGDDRFLYFLQAFRVAYLLPWYWKQYAPLKRQFTSTRLRGATSQKLSSSYLSLFMLNNFEFDGKLKTGVEQVNIWMATVWPVSW
jgi:hypothetical protein